MKCIIKQSEPIEFSAWKQQANEDWQPTYNILGGDVKKSVKASLMEEQGYICCYCEQRLEINDSHIEHFQPQHDSAVDALDYSNILCSCQDQLKKGVPRHCGNLKGDWFDRTFLISPLEPDCEERFHFNGDGTIRPTNAQDQAAVTTIDKLGLNSSLLNDLRNKALEPFLDPELTTEELTEFVSGHLQKNNKGMFIEFWTTIHQLFGG